MPKLHNILLTLNKRGFFTFICATYYHLISLVMRMFKKKYLIKKIYNYKMYLDLNDKGISRTLLLFGKRELEHKKMLEQIIRPNITILDIGANIGYYSLMILKLIGPNGKLIAVEPSPSNIEILKKNLNLNNYNDIEVHNAAISDENSIKKFFLSEMSNLNTLNYTEKKSKLEKILNKNNIEYFDLTTFYKKTNIIYNLFAFGKDVKRGHLSKLGNDITFEFFKKIIGEKK